MAENWIQEQAEVYNDLMEDGVLLSFSRVVKGDFDPVLQAYGQESKVEFQLPGLLTKLPNNSVKSIGWLKDSVVEVGDKMLIVGCKDMNPQIDDQVELYGETWKVVAMSTLEPGMVELMHHLLIRKA
jgi:hypothetical protein